MKAQRNALIDWLSSKLSDSALPDPPGMMVTEPATWQRVGNSLLQFAIPQPEDTLIAPVELRPNFRTPEQIRALRKIMAEEQRARGEMGRSLRNPEYDKDLLGYQSAEDYANARLTRNPKADYQMAIDQFNYLNPPDPIDQILRGSWYHGMSEKARWKSAEALDPDEALTFINRFPSDVEGSLQLAFDRGFPKSLHDAASISNKLGEPAGISLSLTPTVSAKFAADENIHRVMPLYGGPPTQRTVNLMTEQGRNALNDAYDVVANKKLQDYVRRPQIVRKLRENINSGDDITSLLSSKTGPFNQALSNQLQSQGYRGVLYNPKRWYEYEMLMLDPKYALPLDYRPYSEYVPGRPKEPNIFSSIPIDITPKAQKGIGDIEGVMDQNHSRLGDIYNVRPWWDRLSTDVKKFLLQDNPRAEEIIKKLKKP
jgi:hypothetical protein